MSTLAFSVVAMIISVAIMLYVGYQNEKRQNENS